jgi:HlyD family secretion protein
MTRGWGLPALAALGLGLAAASVARQTPEDGLIDPPSSPPRSSFARAVAGVGLVEAEGENVAVSTPLPGLVVAIRVAAGDQVAEGAPLFVLDGRDLEAELVTRRTAVELARARLERLEALPRAEDLPPLEARVREAEAQLADSRLRLARRQAVLAGGATTAEDETAARCSVSAAEARRDAAAGELALAKDGAWKPDLRVARAELAQAEAAARQVETDIERLTVRAPRAGTILQVKVRAGEFAPSGRIDPPLVLLGRVAERLHVRVEVDEHELWRVKDGAPATAGLRGDPACVASLQFVRVEPYVVPKVTLTNGVTERVDTRVLQVIYALDPRALPVRVGQQLDVFIDAR